MRIKRFTMLCIVLSMCLGCDELAADTEDHVQTSTRTHPWARVANEAEIAQSIAELRDLVDSGIAAFHGGPGLLRNYEFVPAPMLQSSENQRILILEGSIGMPDSALGRYKHRVLGIHVFPDEHTFQYVEQFPVKRQSVLLYLVGDYLAKLPYHVPVVSLSSIYESLKDSNNLQIETIRGISSGGLSGHSVTIFEILADLNPEAQFVIATSPDNLVYAKDIFCNFYEENIFAQVEAINHTAAQQVVGLIKKYNINYINISEAKTYDKFVWQYQNACKVRDDYKPLEAIPAAKIARYLALRPHFLKNITEACPTVTIFKALPNNECEANFGTCDPGLEQETLMPVAGLFRIGYFCTPHFYSAQRTGNALHFLPRAQQLASNGADMFINGGFEEIGDYDEIPALPEEALFDRRMGLSVGHLRAMAASWATPVALSFANRLHLDGKWNSPEELKALLKPENMPRLHDPIRHKILELYPNK